MAKYINIIQILDGHTIGQGGEGQEGDQEGGAQGHPHLRARLFQARGGQGLQHQQLRRVKGKTGHLGESVKVTSDEKKVNVKVDISFSKRYLKYLTKKYLKRHSLREFLYVISTNKNAYQIKYFNIQQDNADQE